MHPLQSACSELSRLLERAGAELPRLKETAAPNGSWSRKQILGHLIDSAANNHQRFVRAQIEDELKTPGYAQEAWVATERFENREWIELVQFWLAYNRHLLHLMLHVPSEKLRSLVRIGGDGPVSLEFVMIDYVRHLKQHLEQIGVNGEIE